jgi:hypothetical protein
MFLCKHKRILNVIYFSAYSSSSNSSKWKDENSSENSFVAHTPSPCCEIFMIISVVYVKKKLFDEDSETHKDGRR